MITKSTLDSAVKHPKIRRLMHAAHEGWRQELERLMPGKGQKFCSIPPNCPWDLRLNAASVLTVLEKTKISLESYDSKQIVLVSKHEVDNAVDNPVIFSLMKAADDAWYEAWRLLHPERIFFQMQMEDRPAKDWRLNTASLVAVLKCLGVGEKIMESVLSGSLES